MATLALSRAGAAYPPVKEVLPVCSAYRQPLFDNANIHNNANEFENICKLGMVWNTMVWIGMVWYGEK